MEYRVKCRILDSEEMQNMECRVKCRMLDSEEKQNMENKKVSKQ